MILTAQITRKNTEDVTMSFLKTKFSRDVTGYTNAKSGYMRLVFIKRILLQTSINFQIPLIPCNFKIGKNSIFFSRDKVKIIFFF